MRASRLSPTVSLVGVITVVGLATLLPGTPQIEERSIWCIGCGTRGTADAILNLLLFVPLGIAVMRMGIAFGVAKRTMAGLSVFVATTISGVLELVQYLVPGRHPSVGDILFNTTGAAAGVALVTLAARWLRPSLPVAEKLALTAAASALLVFGLTEYLLAPSLPNSTYYGQWTPNLGHLEWYRGRVIDARIDAVLVPSRRLANSTTVRSLLASGERVDITAVVGPPTTALGSLFSIYDDTQREILLIGPDGDDMILRQRRRSAVARVDQPSVRLAGWLAETSEGDTVRVATWEGERGRCFSLDDREICNLGFTLGTGWMILYAVSPAGLSRTAVNFSWICALLLPFGFWARKTPASFVGGAVVVVGLAAIPLASDLLPTPPIEWVAAASGVVLGIGLRRVLRVRIQP